MNENNTTIPKIIKISQFRSFISIFVVCLFPPYAPLSIKCKNVRKQNEADHIIRLISVSDRAIARNYPFLSPFVYVQKLPKVLNCRLLDSFV